MILLENRQFKMLVKVVAIVTVFTFTFEQVVFADGGSLFSDKLRVKQPTQSKFAGEIANAFGRQPKQIIEPIPVEPIIPLPAKIASAIGVEKIGLVVLGFSALILGGLIGLHVIIPIAGVMGFVAPAVLFLASFSFLYLGFRKEITNDTLAKDFNEIKDTRSTLYGEVVKRFKSALKLLEYNDPNINVIVKKTMKRRDAIGLALSSADRRNFEGYVAADEFRENAQISKEEQEQLGFWGVQKKRWDNALRLTEQDRENSRLGRFKFLKAPIEIIWYGGFRFGYHLFDVFILKFLRHKLDYYAGGYRRYSWADDNQIVDAMVSALVDVARYSDKAKRKAMSAKERNRIRVLKNTFFRTIETIGNYTGVSGIAPFLYKRSKMYFWSSVVGSNLMHLLGSTALGLSIPLSAIGIGLVSMAIIVWLLHISKGRSGYKRAFVAGTIVIIAIALINLALGSDIPFTAIDLSKSISPLSLLSKNFNFTIGGFISPAILSYFLNYFEFKEKMTDRALADRFFGNLTPRPETLNVHGIYRYLDQIENNSDRGLIAVRIAAVLNKVPQIIRATISERLTLNARLAEIAGLDENELIKQARNFDLGVPDVEAAIREARYAGRENTVWNSEFWYSILKASFGIWAVQAEINAVLSYSRGLDWLVNLPVKKIFGVEIHPFYNFAAFIEGNPKAGPQSLRNSGALGWVNYGVNQLFGHTIGFNPFNPDSIADFAKGRAENTRNTEYLRNLNSTAKSWKGLADNIHKTSDAELGIFINNPETAEYYPDFFKMIGNSGIEADVLYVQGAPFLKMNIDQQADFFRAARDNGLSVSLGGADPLWFVDRASEGYQFYKALRAALHEVVLKDSSLSDEQVTYWLDADSIDNKNFNKYNDFYNHLTSSEVINGNLKLFENPSGPFVAKGIKGIMAYRDSEEAILNISSAARQNAGSYSLVVETQYRNPKEQRLDNDLKPIPLPGNITFAGEENRIGPVMSAVMTGAENAKRGNFEGFRGVDIHTEQDSIQQLVRVLAGEKFVDMGNPGDVSHLNKYEYFVLPELPQAEPTDSATLERMLPKNVIERLAAFELEKPMNFYEQLSRNLGLSAWDNFRGMTSQPDIPRGFAQLAVKALQNDFSMGTLRTVLDAMPVSQAGTLPIQLFISSTKEMEKQFYSSEVTLDSCNVIAEAVENNDGAANKYKLVAMYNDSEVLVRGSYKDDAATCISKNLWLSKPVEFRVQMTNSGFKPTNVILYLSIGNIPYEAIDYMKAYTWGDIRTGEEGEIDLKNLPNAKNPDANYTPTSRDSGLLEVYWKDPDDKQETTGYKKFAERHGIQSKNVMNERIIKLAPGSMRVLTFRVDKMPVGKHPVAVTILEAKIGTPLKGDRLGGYNIKKVLVKYAELQFKKTKVLEHGMRKEGKTELADSLNRTAREYIRLRLKLHTYGLGDDHFTPWQIEEREAMAIKIRSILSKKALGRTLDSIDAGLATRLGIDKQPTIIMVGKDKVVVTKATASRNYIRPGDSIDISAKIKNVGDADNGSYYYVLDIENVDTHEKVLVDVTKAGRGRSVLGKEAVAAKYELPSGYVKIGRGQEKPINIKGIKVNKPGHYKAVISAFPVDYVIGDAILKPEEKGRISFTVGSSTSRISGINFKDAPAIDKSGSAANVALAGVSSFGSRPISVMVESTLARRADPTHTYFKVFSSMPHTVKQNDSAVLPLFWQYKHPGEYLISMSLMDADLETGNTIYETDAKGNYVLDENGRPWPHVVLIKDAHTSTGRQEAGNFALWSHRPSEVWLKNMSDKTKEARVRMIVKKIAGKTEVTVNSENPAMSDFVTLKPGGIDSVNIVPHLIPPTDTSGNVYHVVYEVLDRAGNVLIALNDNNLHTVKVVKILDTKKGIRIRVDKNNNDPAYNTLKSDDADYAFIKNIARKDLGVSDDDLLLYKEIIMDARTSTDMLAEAKTEVKQFIRTRIMEGIYLNPDERNLLAEYKSQGLDARELEMKLREFILDKPDRNTAEKSLKGYAKEKQAKVEEDIRDREKKSEKMQEQRQKDIIRQAQSYSRQRLWLLTAIGAVAPYFFAEMILIFILTRIKFRADKEAGRTDFIYIDKYGNVTSNIYRRKGKDMTQDEEQTAKTAYINGSTGATAAKKFENIQRWALKNTKWNVIVKYTGRDWGSEDADMAIITANRRVLNPMEAVVSADYLYAIGRGNQDALNLLNNILGQVTKNINESSPANKYLLSRLAKKQGELGKMLRAFKSPEGIYTGEMSNAVSEKMLKELEILIGGNPQMLLAVHSAMLIRPIVPNVSEYPFFGKIVMWPFQFLQINLWIVREWFGSMACRNIISFKTDSNTAKPIRTYVTLSSDPKLWNYYGGVFGRWLQGHGNIQLEAYLGGTPYLKVDIVGKPKLSDYKRRDLNATEYYDKIADEGFKWLRSTMSYEDMATYPGSYVAPIENLVYAGVVSDAVRLSIGGNDTAGVLEISPMQGYSVIVQNNQVWLLRIAEDTHGQTKARSINTLMSLLNDGDIAAFRTATTRVEKFRVDKNGKPIVKGELVKMSTISVPDAKDVTIQVPEKLKLFGGGLRLDREVSIDDVLAKAEAGATGLSLTENALTDLMEDLNISTADLNFEQKRRLLANNILDNAANKQKLHVWLSEKLLPEHLTEENIIELNRTSPPNVATLIEVITGCSAADNETAKFEIAEFGKIVNKYIKTNAQNDKPGHVGQILVNALDNYGDQELRYDAVGNVLPTANALFRAAVLKKAAPDGPTETDNNIIAIYNLLDTYLGETGVTSLDDVIADALFDGKGADNIIPRAFSYEVINGEVAEVLLDRSGEPIDPEVSKVLSVDINSPINTDEGVYYKGKAIENGKVVEILCNEDKEPLGSGLKIITAIDDSKKLVASAFSYTALESYNSSEYVVEYSNGRPVKLFRVTGKTSKGLPVYNRKGNLLINKVEILEKGTTQINTVKGVRYKVKAVVDGEIVDALWDNNANNKPTPLKQRLITDIADFPADDYDVTYNEDGSIDKLLKKRTNVNLITQEGMVLGKDASGTKMWVVQGTINPLLKARTLKQKNFQQKIVAEDRVVEELKRMRAELLSKMHAIAGTTEKGAPAINLGLKVDRPYIDRVKSRLFGPTSVIVWSPLKNIHLQLVLAHYSAEEVEEVASQTIDKELEKKNENKAKAEAKIKGIKKFLSIDDDDQEIGIAEIIEFLIKKELDAILSLRKISNPNAKNSELDRGYALLMAKERILQAAANEGDKVLTKALEALGAIICVYNEGDRSLAFRALLYSEIAENTCVDNPLASDIYLGAESRRVLRVGVNEAQYSAMDSARAGKETARRIRMETLIKQYFPDYASQRDWVWTSTSVLKGIPTDPDKDRTEPYRLRSASQVNLARGLNDTQNSQRVLDLMDRLTELLKYEGILPTNVIFYVIDETTKELRLPNDNDKNINVAVVSQVVNDGNKNIMLPAIKRAIGYLGNEMPLARSIKINPALIAEGDISKNNNVKAAYEADMRIDRIPGYLSYLISGDGVMADTGFGAWIGKHSALELATDNLMKFLREDISKPYVNGDNTPDDPGLAGRIDMILSMAGRRSLDNRRMESFKTFTNLENWVKDAIKKTSSSQRKQDYIFYLKWMQNRIQQAEGALGGKKNYRGFIKSRKDAAGWTEMQVLRQYQIVLSWADMKELINPASDEMRLRGRVNFSDDATKDEALVFLRRAWNERICGVLKGYSDPKEKERILNDILTIWKANITKAVEDKIITTEKAQEEMAKLKDFKFEDLAEALSDPLSNDELTQEGFDLRPKESIRNLFKMMIMEEFWRSELYLGKDMRTLTTLFSPIPALHRYGFYDTAKYWTCFGPFAVWPGQLFGRIPILPRPFLPTDSKINPDTLPVAGVRLYAGMSPFASPLSGLNRSIDSEHGSHVLWEIVEDTAFGWFAFKRQIGSGPLLNPFTPGRGTIARKVYRLTKEDNFFNNDLWRALGQTMYEHGIQFSLDRMADNPIDGYLLTKNRSKDPTVTASIYDVLKDVLACQSVQVWGDEAMTGMSQGYGWFNYMFFGGSAAQMWLEAVSVFVPGINKAFKEGMMMIEFLGRDIPYREVLEYARFVMGDPSGKLWPADPAAIAGFANEYSREAVLEAINQLKAGESIQEDGEVSEFRKAIQNNLSAYSINDFHTSYIQPFTADRVNEKLTKKQYRDFYGVYESAGIKIIAMSKEAKEKASLYEYKETPLKQTSVLGALKEGLDKAEISPLSRRNKLLLAISAFAIATIALFGVLGFTSVISAVSIGSWKLFIAGGLKGAVIKMAALGAIYLLHRQNGIIKTLGRIYESIINTSFISFYIAWREGIFNWMSKTGLREMIKDKDALKDIAIVTGVIAVVIWLYAGFVLPDKSMALAVDGIKNIISITGLKAVAVDLVEFMVAGNNFSTMLLKFEIAAAVVIMSFIGMKGPYDRTTKWLQSYQKSKQKELEKTITKSVAEQISKKKARLWQELIIIVGLLLVAIPVYGHFYGTDPIFNLIELYRGLASSVKKGVPALMITLGKGFVLAIGGVLAVTLPAWIAQNVSDGIVKATNAVEKTKKWIDDFNKKPESIWKQLGYAGMRIILVPLNIIARFVNLGHGAFESIFRFVRYIFDMEKKPYESQDIIHAPDEQQQPIQPEDQSSAAQAAGDGDIIKVNEDGIAQGSDKALYKRVNYRRNKNKGVYEMLTRIAHRVLGVSGFKDEESRWRGIKEEVWAVERVESDSEAASRYESIREKLKALEAGLAVMEGPEVVSEWNLGYISRNFNDYLRRIEEARQKERYNLVAIGGGACTRVQGEAGNILKLAMGIEDTDVRLAASACSSDNGGLDAQIRQALFGKLGHTVPVGDLTNVVTGLLGPAEGNIFDTRGWRLANFRQKDFNVFTAKDQEGFSSKISDVDTFSGRVEELIDFYVSKNIDIDVHFKKGLIELAKLVDKHSGILLSGKDKGGYLTIDKASVRHMILYALMIEAGAYSEERKTIDDNRFKVGLYLLEKALGLEGRVVVPSTDYQNLYAEWHRKDGKVYSARGQVAISLAPDEETTDAELTVLRLNEDPKLANAVRLNDEALGVLKNIPDNGIVVLGPSSFVVSLCPSILLLKDELMALKKRGVKIALVLNYSYNNETLGFRGKGPVAFLDFIKNITDVDSVASLIDVVLINTNYGEGDSGLAKALEDQSSPDKDVRDFYKERGKIVIDKDDTQIKQIEDMGVDVILGDFIEMNHKLIKDREDPSKRTEILWPRHNPYKLAEAYRKIMGVSAETQPLTATAGPRPLASLGSRAGAVEQPVVVSNEELEAVAVVAEAEAIGQAYEAQAVAGAFAATKATAMAKAEGSIEERLRSVLLDKGRYAMIICPEDYDIELFTKYENRLISVGFNQVFTEDTIEKALETLELFNRDSDNPQITLVLNLLDNNNQALAILLRNFDSSNMVLSNIENVSAQEIEQWL